MYQFEERRDISLPQCSWFRPFLFLGNITSMPRDIVCLFNSLYFLSLFFSSESSRDTVHLPRKIETRHIAIIFNQEMASNRNKRKVLSLEERIRVVELNKVGKSCRKIADELGVGKPQIQNVILA